MAFIDYYKILGVNKDIRTEDVREAYRKRAKQFHPDLHPNDPKAKAKFQALNEAYDVIGDPEKRKKYDKYGERWKEADAFNNSGRDGMYGHFYKNNAEGSTFDGFDFSKYGDGNGFSDFFQSMFGMGGHTHGGKCSARQNNGDMNATVNIDLYTALLGGDIIIQLGNGAKIKLRVKPETQNNTKVRIRGKGYRREDRTCGDLIITYNVVLPKNLTEYQKDLVRQMKA